MRLLSGLKRWGIAIGLLFQTSTVFAATSSFDIINFNPTTDNSGYFAVYGSRTLNPTEFNMGLSFDYAKNPLQCDGCPTQDVISDLVLGHMLLVVGATEWLQLGADIPVVIYSKFYNDTTGAQEFDGSMGDIRVEPKFRLVNIETRMIGLSFLPFVTLPTGDSSQFLGNGHVTGGAKLITDINIKDRVGLALNVGYRFRDDVTRTSTRIDDQVLYGAGLSIHATRHLDVIVEATGYTVSRDLWDSIPQSPAEGELGFRYRMDNGFAISAGGGVGIVDGVGAPQYRTLLGLSFAPPVSKNLGEDGVTESYAELRRRARQTTYADLKRRKVITERIYFDFDKATIQSRSYPILDAVAEVLQDMPGITLLQVEGHADEIGSDAYNQTLSEDRAKAAMEYLAQKGVTPSRLTYRGFGKSQPIAPNDTEEGRALNRRTEFIILTWDNKAVHKKHRK